MLLDRSLKVRRKKGGRYSYIAIYIPLEAARNLGIEPETYYILERSEKEVVLMERRIDASEVEMLRMPVCV